MPWRSKVMEIFNARSYLVVVMVETIFFPSEWGIKALWVQHTISHLHQISQEYMGIYVHQLCHMHSATHWTQEVRKTSSDWHDVYCLFSPQYDMQVTGECTIRRHRSLIHLLAVMVPSISILRHEASSPHNFTIQCPICAKSLRNVEGGTLHISVHQICVISIAPPTGHRKSVLLLVFSPAWHASNRWVCSPTLPQPDVRGRRGPVHHCLQL